MPGLYLLFRLLLSAGMELFCSVFLSFKPTPTIALIAGISSWPSSVSAYSTEGGEVGTTRRVITPFSSSSRSRALRTVADIRGMSLRNSPKRRRFSLKYQITLGVHAPHNSVMHSVSGHAGGGTLLFRNRNPMGNSLQ